MASWTQEDVDRINAQRGAKLPAHIGVSVGVRTPLPQRFVVPEKTHKYRAEPCIVTADLTLFTRADLDALEVAPPLRFPKPLKGSMKNRAAILGIIGDWFGSTKEAKRWIALKQMETAGEIARLGRQRRWPLFVRPTFSATAAQIEIAVYVSDFDYDLLTPQATIMVVEDCKGLRTAMYKRSKKHFQAQYGITITET